MLFDNERPVCEDRTLKYLEWFYAAGCVLDVYRENQQRDTVGTTISSRSEAWTDNDRLRYDLHERACKFWCARTGLDHTYFPLSIDAVARLYLRLRKRNAAESERFEAKIEEACKRAGKVAE
jgi:hypothetical protein